MRGRIGGHEGGRSEWYLQPRPRHNSGAAMSENKFERSTHRAQSLSNPDSIMMMEIVAFEVGEVKGEEEKEIGDCSDTLVSIFGWQTMDSSQVYFKSPTPKKQPES